VLRDTGIGPLGASTLFSRTNALSGSSSKFILEFNLSVYVPLDYSSNGVKLAHDRARSFIASREVRL
jgi:hypothetical protein